TLQGAVVEGPGGFLPRHQSLAMEALQGALHRAEPDIAVLEIRKYLLGRLVRPPPQALHDGKLPRTQLGAAGATPVEPQPGQQSTIACLHINRSDGASDQCSGSVEPTEPECGSRPNTDLLSVLGGRVTTAPVIRHGLH